MNSVFYNVFLVLLLFLCSCGINKKTLIINSVNDINTSRLIDNVNSNNSFAEWTYIKGKLNIRTAEATFNVNTNIRIRKDSVIWISVTMPIVGELFRGILTKDSVYLLNRKNSTYIIEPSSYLDNYFSSASHLNLFQEIVSSSITLDSNIIKTSNNNSQYVLRDNNFQYTVDPINFRVIALQLFSPAKDTLSLEYKNYSESNGFIFPKQLEITIPFDQEYSFILNYNKLTFNKPQKFPFNIPKNYAKVR